jgi:OPA family sugar phosphate sensor protein UhpC-like MFS transporter
MTPSPAATRGAVASRALWGWQVRVFVATWLGYAGFYLTRKSLSVAKVELKKPEVWGLSNETLATVDGGYLVAYALGQFLWGVLGDRLGTRRVVLAGMAGSVAVAVAMGTAASVAGFGLLFALQGVFQSSGWAPLTKNMGEFFPRRVRGRVMGFWCTNFALGGMIAGIVAGVAAKQGGWRMAFLVPAGMLAVIWLVFAALQADRPEDVGLPSPESASGDDEAVIVAGDQVADEPEGAWRTILDVVTSPTVLVISFVYLLVKPLRYLLMFWAPVYLNERLGTDVAESGMLGSLFDLAGPVGIIAGGWASDRLFGTRRFPVMAITLVAAGLALAALPWMPPTRGAVGAALFVIGLLVYIPDSLASGAAAIDFGTRRGAATAAGMINGCGSLGGVVGGTLPGLVAATTADGRTPWNVLFLALAAGLVIAGAAVAPLWNRLPPRTSRS